MLHYYYKTVVFQEIPNKISYSYSITGCGGICPNCHSEFLHKLENGSPLSLAEFENDLKRYSTSVEVILFLGGEWEESLVDYLKLARSYGLLTALYSGQNLDKIDKGIIENLDYLKVGHYDELLGGLNKTTTNQKLYDVKNGFVDITSSFWQKGI